MPKELIGLTAAIAPCSSLQNWLLRWHVRLSDSFGASGEKLLVGARLEQTDRSTFSSAKQLGHRAHIRVEILLSCFWTFSR